MKKMLSMLALSALCFAGCQNELETVSGAGSGEERMVRIALEAPEAMALTRASGAGYTNSAKGGVTNVDRTKYDLRYKLAVYDAKGKTVVVEPMTKAVQGTGTNATTFDVALVEGQEYKFVAWADFVTAGSTADLHYNTADLTAISCKDAADKQLNDESRDAYFVTKNLAVNAAQGVSLTLRRPFAKVRVVASDVKMAGTDMPDNFKITYYGCQRFTSLNAITGVATGSKLNDNESTAYTAKLVSTTEKDYTEDYDATDGFRTLTVDYLLAETDNQTEIHFKWEALKGTSSVFTYNCTTDIPIQRNFLTTIFGNMLTGKTGVAVSVVCDEIFEGEFKDMESEAVFAATKPEFDGNVVYIRTAGELVWLQQNAITAGTDNDAGLMNEHFNLKKGAVGEKGYTFKLENNIDLKGTKWEPIRWLTSKDYRGMCVFDGQGHTIKNFECGAKSEKVTKGLFSSTNLSIKNLTVENVIILNAFDGQGALVGYFTGETIENCTVKNVHIRMSESATAPAVNYTEVGGMVGSVGSYVSGVHTSMKNCKAENVDIRSSYAVGGLVGQCDYVNIELENCSVTNATLWITYLNERHYNKVGSIVGYIAANSLTLKNCTASDITYKVGTQATEAYIIEGGEEGTQEYGPKYALYGYSGEAATVKVENDEP